MNQGFTLIELLVVVLLIGILSAIALPQYELAVEKSRAAEVFVVSKAIMDAVQRYEQANPNDTPTSFNQLVDVDLKNGEISGNMFRTKNFLYQLTSSNGFAYVRVKRLDAGETLYQVDFFSYNNPNDREPRCTTEITDYEPICALFENIFKR